MKCPIPGCYRDNEEGKMYCYIHYSAFDHLRSSYPIWNRGWGVTFTTEEYFKRLEALGDFTGKAVREVMNYLRSQGFKFESVAPSGSFE